MKLPTLANVPRLALLLLLPLLACQTSEPSEIRVFAEPLGQAVVSARPAAGTPHTSVPASTTTSAFDLDTERRLKATMATPLAHIRDVDWTEAEALPRLAEDTLRSEARAALAAIPLPVLLPEDPALLSAALVTSGDHWYAASMPLDGHTVFVTGSRVVFEVPGISGEALEGSGGTRAGGILLSHNELIATLSFNAYGASYLITVECDSPTDDPRCTQDDYILGLAEGLRLLEEGP